MNWYYIRQLVSVGEVSGDEYWRLAFSTSDRAEAIKVWKALRASDAFEYRFQLILSSTGKKIIFDSSVSHSVPVCMV